MAMSKKHFIALANEFKPVLAGFRPIDPTDVVEALVRFCGAQNPQFNEARFRSYIAGECGPNGGAVKGAK